MMLCSKIRRTTTGEISVDYLLPDNSSSLASVIARNSDILIQILLCLPVKSLLVFKSVSNQWFCLISETFFIRGHFLRNHRHSIPGMFLPKPCHSIPGLYLPSPSYSDNHNFKSRHDFISLDGTITDSDVPLKTPNFKNEQVQRIIQQSCNGLLYCTCSYASAHYIYNPSTKLFKSFPLSPSIKNNSAKLCSVTLAFDPLKSPHYEVVLLSVLAPIYESNNYQIEIFSSKTATWRVSRNSFSQPSSMYLSGSGVFWNGSVHWVSCFKESFFYYFNIECEIVKTLPMPPIPDGWQVRNIEYFGECMGHMHLIEIYAPSTTCFDIMEMDTEYTGWKCKYRVDLKELPSPYPTTFDVFVLLVEEGEETSSRLVLNIADKIFSYDLNKMSFKKIHDLSPSFRGEGSVYNRRIYAYQYIESLANV